jgi:hypothetical protein
MGINYLQVNSNKSLAVPLEALEPAEAVELAEVMEALMARQEGLSFEFECSSAMTQMRFRTILQHLALGAVATNGSPYNTVPIYLTTNSNRGQFSLREASKRFLLHQNQ